jgi:tryptophan synthase alpha subunit
MQHLKTIADGAIVGSAIVKLMNSHREKSPDEVAAAVASYCREMICAGTS